MTPSHSSINHAPSCRLLIAAVGAFVSTDVVSTYSSQVKISQANEDKHHTRRFLRSFDGDKDVTEERMFEVGSINSVLGKVGSVVDLGAAEKVAKAADKVEEEYKKWIRLGYTPSQVRVDILKKEPWMSPQFLADHPQFRQYAKYMVTYKMLNPYAI